jgi:hypothetical protein
LFSPTFVTTQTFLLQTNTPTSKGCHFGGFDTSYALHSHLLAKFSFILQLQHLTRECVIRERRTVRYKRSIKWTPFLVAMGWDYVSVELRPPTDPLSIPQMIHEWIWSSGGTILTRETEGLGEKPVSVPLCPPQIPHELTWARTWFSVVRKRRLTAWVMVRRNWTPHFTLWQFGGINVTFIKVTFAHDHTEDPKLLIKRTRGLTFMCNVCLTVVSLWNIIKRW